MSTAPESASEQSIKKEILINSTPQETRVALLENRVLAEIFIERKRDRGILGNIYKGRVMKVLPGMQAAFVDIGLQKAGFLYVADVQEAPEEFDEFIFDEGGENGAGDEARAVGAPLPLIQEILREGQEILVQVSKEPLGTKGPRLTSRVALPGRYLVYLPGEDHVGISRRITDETERERLRTLLESIKPTVGGVIVRTVAEGGRERDFRKDLDFLQRLWKKIKEKGDKARPPHLIHSDLDILLKTVRDHFTDDIDRVLVDDPDDHRRLLDFIKTYLPHLRSRIELWGGQEPLFDAYNLELEIGKILEHKVWLKSGGYIAIDSTEALVTVDVNTGKYIGKTNFEETILKTNLEAAKEIAYQLRLRNLGGIIILDFIDMENEKNRERVYKALEEALKDDRANPKILKISELGLVEMSRKRARPTVEKTLCQQCPYCKGKGLIKSVQTVSYEILREIPKATHTITARTLVVEAHPEVADHLMEAERMHLEWLEQRLGRNLSVQANPALHREEYVVLPGAESGE